MKKKLLFIGISMECAGTEKAFLSLADAIDYERYDVDLLLARKSGPLLDSIPPQINIIEMTGPTGLFFLSSKNAFATIWRSLIKPKPSSFFTVLPWFLKLVFARKKRSFTAARMWVALMKKYMPEFDGSGYDAVIAYWGDRTMFYMLDMVKGVKRNIAWLHFDYANPPREDALYEPCFARCDAVVTVSESIDAALREALPSVAERCVSMENIISGRLIRTEALKGETFPDVGYKGKRILSVCRLSYQKGVDFIIPVLSRLRKEGIECRWYIIGDGEESERSKLIEAAFNAEVADIFMLLGTKLNPYSFMRDCDVFVLPSRFEGRPITVEEAKILMKPIVVSDYLSAREQLWDGELGIVTPMGEEGIYRGVRRMLSDSSLRDRLTVKLSKCDFGTEDRIDRFYDIVEGCLPGKNDC